MPNATRQQLAHFLARSHETMRLGGVTFWINPTSFTMATTTVHTDVPTRAGFVRFHYGQRPNVYAMSGTTGTSGYDGPGGLRDLERIRPKDVLPQPEQLLPFYFPNRFSGVRWVYVNSFTDSMQQDSPLYYYYEMELIEYPTPAHATTKSKTGRSLPDPLPYG